MVGSLTSPGIATLSSAVRTAVLDLVIKGPSGRVLLPRATSIPKAIPGAPLDLAVALRASTLQALQPAAAPGPRASRKRTRRVQRLVLGEVMGAPPTHYRFPNWWLLELRYCLRLEDLFEALRFFLRKLEAKRRHCVAELLVPADFLQAAL